MPQQLVIIGTGFAGLWSALSAKRLLQLRNKEDDVEITIVAPKPSIVLRPRLYEADAAGMTQDIGPLLQDASIKFFQGFVQNIDTEAQKLSIESQTAGRTTLGYDRLILASGSAVVRPAAVKGLAEYAFDIDSIASASKLEEHLKTLAGAPASPARDTVVVCGGGFTGVELATELPSRIAAGMRVVLVEGAKDIGPELGPGPRPIITKALEQLGVKVKLGSTISSIDEAGVTLTSGERIATLTAIWTAGVKASPLTQQISAKKDTLGRVIVDKSLAVPSVKHLYVAGDTAHALADPTNAALMSCQHALVLGRFAGYNAAADLIGEPSMDYTQPAYNTCLDLGGFGAVITNGWQRTVMMEGEIAKKVKTKINRSLIYPPKDLSEAIAAADPNFAANSDELFRQLLVAIQAGA